jgi:glyoxylase-like metal-dependent hydrolase (beta-lactamase superfamily II)
MQVTEHVHALKIPFQITVNPEIRIDRFVYVYLIFGRHIYMIDSAVAPAKEMILEYIRKAGRDPEEIATLFLTHSHPDHIGAALGLQGISGCKVAAHELERPWIEDCTRQAKERPIPGFNFLVEGSVKVDTILEDGDIVTLEDGLSLRVYHTPGHSIGSISFYLPSDRALFSGDLIPLKGDIPVYEDARAVIRSMQKLEKAPNVSTLFSSWDDPRQHGDIAKQFEEGFSYLRDIDNLMEKNKERFQQAPLETCKAILFELGVPVSAAIPLVMKSLASHIHN